MFLSKIYNVISSFIVFLFIFGIYNDNFVVDHLGANALKISFGLFIVFNIVRIFRNLRDPEMMRDLVPFFIFIGLLFFVMIMNPPTGEDSDQKLFENVLLLLSMFLIVSFFINYELNKLLYFIWLAMMASAFMAYFNEPITRWTFRKTGGTGDPNEFASQMVAFLFLTIYLFRQNKNVLFLVISLAGIIYSILFAGSMSSFLVLGAMGVLVLIRYLSMSFVKSMILTIVTLVAVITTVIVFREKIEKIEIVGNILGRTQNTATADTRFNSWAAGMKMIVEKPVMGVGMRMYGRFSPKYSSVYLTEDSVAPHNLYLEVIAESGVIVFFAFGLFLFTLMSRYFRQIVHSDYFWIYMGVVAYLLMGLTLGLTYNKFIWLTFTLLLQVHYILGQEREVEVIDLSNGKLVLEAGGWKAGNGIGGMEKGKGRRENENQEYVK